MQQDTEQSTVERLIAAQAVFDSWTARFNREAKRVELLAAIRQGSAWYQHAKLKDPALLLKVLQEAEERYRTLFD